MKTQLTRLVSIGIALAAVAAVHAQEKNVAANVPFSFYVGSSLMPQGVYRVNELAHGTVVRIESIQSETAKSATTHEVTGGKQIEPARLVFHRYGDTYFLSEIWTGDASSGQALARSAHEKELAKSGAAPRLAMILAYLNR